MLPEGSFSINSKRGKELVFLDLESYVDELVDNNQVRKTNRNYISFCPYCVDAYLKDSSYEGPYNKEKLYISLDKKYGHCFRCDKIFLHYDDDFNFEFDWDVSVINEGEFKVSIMEGKWDMNRFSDYSTEHPSGEDYLINERHRYFKQLIKALRIRFTEEGNPVVPFYYKNELIYYQIKLKFGNYPMPYFSPPIRHKPAYIIEHGDNKKFVISEGTFDGIANLILYPDRTPFSLLGSVITDYQVDMLRTYDPEDILIYLDNTELSMKLATHLSKVLPYANLNVRKSTGQDPEEYLKYKLSLEAEQL